MKSILQKILAFLARRTLRKYRPLVVGITGSVGKTSTREAVFAVLSKKHRVRQAEKNYNNEIGFPLAILGIRHYGKNIFGWIFALSHAFDRTLFRSKNFPEILVLEYGIDRPGDMDYLLSVARPDIAVVTAIGDVPVHVEFFESPEALIAEKSKLPSAVHKNGYVILNHDDFAVLGMKENTKGKVITFGEEEHADVRIMNYKNQVLKDRLGNDIPGGVAFKIENRGSTVPIRLHSTFGMPQVYSASAAVAAGLAVKMNLAEISEALAMFHPPAGRLRLLEGIKNSYILDDTYNAAPEAMRMALDTLEMLPGKRKIAVLGDMLEIGRYSEAVHRAIGDRAAQFADMLFCVGPRAKFIAEEAMSRGIEKNSRTMAHNQVFMFDGPVSAGRALKPIIRAGDLVLIKGSQGMRMERAVEEVMEQPDRADELLVRHDKFWKKN